MKIEQAWAICKQAMSQFRGTKDEHKLLDEAIATIDADRTIGPGK